MKFHLFAICLALLTLNIADAQILDLEHYTTRNGLIFNDVGSMYQDSLGRLWLGTSEGLSIYDGSEFKNYRTDDGLPREFITSITASRESPTAAWIGTLGGGVCKLVDERFSRLDLGPNPDANAINALCEDRNGILWIGTGAGLFRVENGSATSYPLDARTISVTGIAEAGDGAMWFGLTHSALRYEEDKPTTTINLGLEPDEYMSAMRADGTDMWFGTSRGRIVRVNGDGVITRTKISDSKIHDIVADSNRKVWACSENGLFALERISFNTRAPVRFGMENGFVREFFLSAFVDREGNLWLGGLGMGLYKLRDRALLRFPFVPLKPGFTYNPPAVADPEGHLWIIDGESIIELSQRSDSMWTRQRQGIKNAKLHSLQCGPENTLWVGLLDGDINVYRIHRKAGSADVLRLVRVLRRGIELPEEQWSFFVIDGRGSLWLGIHPIGVIVLHGQQFQLRTTLNAPDDVPHPDIRAIHEARNGDIWVGGLGGGIVVYRSTPSGYVPVRRLVSGKGLDDEDVRSILVDRKGRCWTGTRWGGVTLTDGDTWRTLTTDDGLLSNAVISLAEDSIGIIWVGTPLGLQGIDAESFRLTITVPGLVGESVHHCGVVGNTVWAYTQKSLAIYKPDASSTSPVPPLISIRELRVNGAERPISHALELAHDENNIAIDFVGVSLKNEKGVRYRYRLLGAEHEWSSSTLYRSVRYAALKPGAYTFEVEAANADGISTVLPATVSFTILLPVWQRWWFQFGILILVAGLAWIIHDVRITKLLEIERTRIRIAHDLHDEIGSTLSSITYFAQAMRSSKRTEDGSNAERLLSLIAESSSKAKGAIGDIIWSIDPSNDNWDDLLARMRRHASDVLESKRIRYSITLPDHLVAQPPAMQLRRNLWLLFKEMVANIAQHSRCSRVEIEMKVAGRDFDLVVKDNGVGFDRQSVAKGTGLKSIQERARVLGAEAQLSTVPGEGTIWHLRWKR